MPPPRQDWGLLDFLTLKLVHTEYPGICLLQLKFFYFGTGSSGCSYSLASAPRSCDTLHPLVCLSNWGEGGSSVPYDLKTLLDLKDLLILFVQLFSCCENSSDDFQVPYISGQKREVRTPVFDCFTLAL